MMEQVQYIGKIDRTLYRCVAEDILSDEVILTEERAKHIISRRGQLFYDTFRPYFADILADPDYIFEDERENTALVCKTIIAENAIVNLVLRLTVEGEDGQYKNSIITAIRENDKRFTQRLRNRMPLYKRVDKPE